MELQPELFDCNDPNIFKWNKKKVIDYEKIYQLFLKGPVTFKQIQEAVNVSYNEVAQVITTLTFKYPIYELKHGVYKLYGDDDYGDGIKKHLNLDDDADEW